MHGVCGVCMQAGGDTKKTKMYKTQKDKLHPWGGWGLYVPIGQKKLRNVYEFEKLLMNSKVGRKFEESSQFLKFDKYYMFFKRS